MKLSERLEEILKYSDGCTLADIGTDHGFIPIEAVKRGICKNAIASDINDGPLKRAREHISQADLTKKIDVRLGGGLSILKTGEADVIVITGMGGLLIRDILSADKETAASAKKLVLSPQSDLYEFRKYLISEGYKIISEACIFEDGKYYFIIKAAPESSKDLYTDSELTYGKKSAFDEKSLIIRNKMIQKDISVYKTIIDKLPKEKETDKRKEELLSLIRIAEGA